MLTSLKSLTLLIDRNVDINQTKRNGMSMECQWNVNGMRKLSCNPSSLVNHMNYGYYGY